MNEPHFAALDLNLLRVFDTMLSERSVTRAGERLGLTQSAVSHALGRLRQIMGDELFVRRSTSMEPTPRALEIGPALHTALLQMRAALAPAVFDPSTTERRFAVAAGSYACMVLIPAVAAAFRRQAPTATLRIAPPGLGVAEALDSGRVDAAIGLETAARRFSFQPLVTETMVWAVRTGHPLTEGPLTLERLTDVPHVLVSGYEDPPEDPMVSGVTAAMALRTPWDQPEMMRELTARKLERKVGVVAPDAISALAIAIRSDMAVMIPRRLAEAGAIGGRVALLELPYPSALIDVGAVFRADRMSDPAIAWLSSILAEAGRTV